MAKQKTTIILSIILVVAVIAAIIFYSQIASLKSQNANLQSQIQTAKTNAINGSADVFDANFHDLLQENSYLLADTARRSLSNSSAAFNATLLALQNNINFVGNLLAPIYGSNSQQLVNLWNQKANIFINYSNSLKNNDPNALAYYNAAIAAYIPQAVTFWTTTQNPYPALSQTTATNFVTTSLSDTKATIDDWYAGNYNQYYTDLHTSYIDMGTYADVVAGAIIQQNPQDFQ
ncbi:MAG: hypothetical protein ABSG05_01995 [Candidatus Pacearchaeota archaeon]|jgi:ABC-type multidrug transport system fused ATPase/permease subunit